jgi:hypothetical protein
MLIEPRGTHMVSIKLTPSIITVLANTLAVEPTGERAAPAPALDGGNTQGGGGGFGV